MATTNPLLQQIDAIAKEKGVEPEIIISAVQDALEAAARKRYKSEALRARFNTDSGQLELYAVKKIVEEVTDASTQISLTEAQELYGDEAEVDMEIEFPRPTEDLGRIAALLSRTDPALLIKLFEQEVPEIYDGTVMIRGAVREAGDRAKVAVYSRERDVDPVGACVGMKGTRVQSIIRELRGEKIDIVEWSEDPILFVTNAISPAKAQRVSIVDDAEKVMEVVVEDKQLSLAIGKKGQNVRLAAKLTGWKIDIKSEEEKRREVEAQLEPLLEAGESSGEQPAEGEASEGGGELEAAGSSSPAEPMASAAEAGAAAGIDTSAQAGEAEDAGENPSAAGDAKEG